MRRRIMLLVVGMTALVVLAFAIPLAILIRHVVYQDATKSLSDTANSIAVYLRNPEQAPTNDAIAATVKAVSGQRSACVELPDGTVLGTPPPGRLPNLPPQNGGAEGSPGSLGPADDQHGDGAPGGPSRPASQSFHGGQLAQLSVPVRGGSIYVISVYASDSQLHSGEARWWWLLGGGSVGLLLLGVLGGEVLTRRIVRPLLRTASTAHALSVGETGARAPTRGPREIAEVGIALNRLADRIDELIAEERETVADLSHRLRTPLTALRLDAEALRDRVEAERVGQHVNALERMLTAVIRAARRPQREGRMPSCDATEVVGDRVAFWSALAEDQGRSTTVTLPTAPLPVRASAEDLAAALDALLENVIAHTPEGIAFAVALTEVGDGARLTVTDDGPGLGENDVVRGRSDRGSSGLGLDIARRCAEAAGGAMTLGRSPSGGAAIALELKAP